MSYHYANLATWTGFCPRSLVHPDPIEEFKKELEPFLLRLATARHSCLAAAQGILVRESCGMYRVTVADIASYVCSSKPELTAAQDSLERLVGFVQKRFAYTILEENENAKQLGLFEGPGGSHGA